MFKQRVTLTFILILALLFVVACSPNGRSAGTGDVAITTDLQMSHSVYNGQPEDVTYANTTCVTGPNGISRTVGDHPAYFTLLTQAQKERCFQIISVLCDEFDSRSRDIEPIPAGVSEEMRQIRLQKRRTQQSIRSSDLVCGFDGYSATNGEYCHPYTDRAGRRHESKYQVFIRGRTTWDKYDSIFGNVDVVPYEFIQSL